MAVTINTSIGLVKLKELYEGYEAGIDIQRGPFVSKAYLCPTWKSAFPACNALMGSGRPPTGRHICPESKNLKCTSAVIVPKGEFDARDSDRPAFNLPIIRTQYTIPTWEELATDDPEAKQSFPNEIAPGQPFTYMDQSIDYEEEVILLPSRSYKFETDNKVCDTPVTKSIGVARFMIVRKWQEKLPHVNYTKYRNKLNTSTFLGQPKGQIRFANARTRKQFVSDGSGGQEIDLCFQWREYDHNTEYHPDFNSFIRIKDGSGNFKYQYDDLTQLLR